MNREEIISAIEGMTILELPLALPLPLPPLKKRRPSSTLF